MSADILRILVVLLGIAVVAIVLIQQPKEGGMGMFSGGGGASSTVFGAKGSGSFLFRLTAGLTLAFAISIIALVKVTNSGHSGKVLSAEATDIVKEVIPGKVNEVPSASANDAIPGAVQQDSAPETIPGAASSNGSDVVPGAVKAPEKEAQDKEKEK